jgi:hypothetical protein
LKPPILFYPLFIVYYFGDIMNCIVIFLVFLVITLSAQPSETLQSFADERSASYKNTHITMDLVEAWVKDAGTRLHERHLAAPSISQ